MTTKVASQVHPVDEVLPLGRMGALGLQHVLVLSLIHIYTARRAGAHCGSQGSFVATTTLDWNNALASAALVHSDDMVARDFFSHTGSDGRDAGDRATVRRFVQDEVAPWHAQWEREGQVPKALWRRAGELGLLCLTMPEAYGGAGVDFSYSAIVVEELMRAGATGPLFYLHSDIVAPYLLHYGSCLLYTSRCV